MSICLACGTHTLAQVVREGPDAPSPRGFSSLVRMNSLGKDKTMRSTRYVFEAPGVIRVRSEGKKDGEPIFGAALHCIPIGQGRSRILFKVSFLRNTSALLRAFTTTVVVMGYFNIVPFRHWLLPPGSMWQRPCGLSSVEDPAVR